MQHEKYKSLSILPNKEFCIYGFAFPLYKPMVYSAYISLSPVIEEMTSIYSKNILLMVFMLDVVMVNIFRDMN